MEDYAGRNCYLNGDDLLLLEPYISILPQLCSYVQLIEITASYNQNDQILLFFLSHSSLICFYLCIIFIVIHTSPESYSYNYISKYYFH